ncbi:MAG TPA: DUF2157 domain-containing protein [Puia sp.]|nr:DUF2157 domain-containing protein [Puia sp.]
MDLNTFQKLHAGGLISDDSLQKVTTVEEQRLFSLHWELKTLLYLGVTLLSGGLGILVYKNIDTIGHQAVLAFIALVCGGCFYYCLRKSLPFSRLKVLPPDSFYDYILLLGCLTLLTFIGYLQFQYRFFGEAWGLASFIPMVILFISAYYFDHLGVLSVAITNMAAWMGIAITPMHILKDNPFSDTQLIYTGLLLGAILVLAGLVSEKRSFKKHFEFTYANFGTHLLFISGLAGLFIEDNLLWFLLLLGMGLLFYRLALRRRSFYFLLITILYTYIALCYAVVHLIAKMSFSDSGPLYLGLIYFILSAIGVVRVLIILNRKMRAHDSV